jgi:hypothetical protein
VRVQRIGLGDWISCIGGLARSTETDQAIGLGLCVRGQRELGGRELKVKE